MATTKGTAAYGREMKIEGSGKKARITVGPVGFRLDTHWRHDYYTVEAYPTTGSANTGYSYHALCEYGAERGYNTPRKEADRHREIGTVHPETDWNEKTGTEFRVYKRGDRSALPTITPVEGDQYRKLTDAFAVVVAEYVATPVFRAWCREIDLLVATYAAEKARADAEAEADRMARTTAAMGITIERHADRDDPSVTMYGSEDLYGYWFRSIPTDGGGATVEMWRFSYPKNALAIGTIVPAGAAFAVVTEMKGVSPQLPSLRFPTIDAATEYLIRERALDHDRMEIDRNRKYEADVRAQCEAERAKMTAKLAAKTAARDTYAAQFATGGI